jgi:hypothetical protein
MRTIVRHEMIINGRHVMLTADYYEGYKGSLEEPSEPAGWDLEQIWIDDAEYHDLDEVATILDRFTWYELWAEIEDQLNNEYDSLIKFNKKHSY